jgi:CubicO group peptidase (beta-lactamase class C family)
MENSGIIFITAAATVAAIVVIRSKKIILNGIKASLFISALLILFNGCENASCTSIPNTPNTKHIMDSSNTRVLDSIKYDNVVKSFLNGREFSASLLIAKHGAITFCKSYGMADYANKIPNISNTRYYISSMTKPITAVAIMQLAEKGSINLTDYVTKYLPECVELKNISLINLLTHSSGLARNFSFESMSPSPEMISQAIKGLPLEFEPGSKYSYSSIGYYILGAVIEKVTGQSYESYINENIFKPANMKYSGCEGNAQTLTEFASGHSYYNGSLVQEYMNMNTLFSAGCIYSNVMDMYLFNRALFRQNLLKSQTLNEMYTPLFDTDVKNRSIGIGWFISRVGNETYIEHGGLSNGYNSYISSRISDGSVIIILSNISNPQVGTKELIRFIYERMD